MDTPVNLSHFRNTPIGKTADGKDVFLNHVWFTAVFDAIVKRLGGSANYALSDIADLTPTDSNIIVGDGSTWVAESGDTARTSLGLGTGDSPQFTAVNIGHASDTTLTRASAGVVAAEGSNLIKADGTVPLTANWDVGAFKVTASQLESDVVTGTAPLVVASTTKVDNLHVARATLGDTVTVADAGADTTTWVLLGTSQTGNLSPATDAGLTYNANTNALTATTFVGALSGAATQITVANEATDTTCFPTFVTAATGDLGPKSNTGLTFNSSTGAFGAVTLTSTVSTGTAPLTVSSTTKISNLNADLLDDQTGSYYLDSANFTGTNWTDLTDAGATTLHKHDHGGQDGLSDDDHSHYWNSARGAARVSLRA